MIELKPNEDIIYEYIPLKECRLNPSPAKEVSNNFHPYYDFGQIPSLIVGKLKNPRQFHLYVCRYYDITTDHYLLRNEIE